MASVLKVLTVHPQAIFIEWDPFFQVGTHKDTIDAEGGNLSPNMPYEETLQVLYDLTFASLAMSTPRNNCLPENML